MNALHMRRTGVLALSVALTSVAVWLLLGDDRGSLSSHGARVEFQPAAPPAESPAEPLDESQVDRSIASHELPKDRVATVTFVDEMDVPIPACSLSLVDGRVERQLGIADNSGSLVLDATAIEGQKLIARGGHCRPRLVQMPDRVEVVCVVLKRLGVIHGMVRLRDGSVPENPIRVVAFESGRPPTCTEANSPTETRSYQTTTTDAIGRFTIADLDPMRRFSIAGAGSGYVLDRSAEGVAPSGPIVLVNALPLYGLRVSLVEASGQPIAPDDRVVPVQGGGIRCMDSTAQDVNLANELFIAHVDGVGCHEVYNPNSFVLAYSTESGKDEIPVLLAIERPGYRPRRATVRVPRLRDTLATHAVQLERDGLDAGELRVRIRWTGGTVLTEGGVRLSAMSGGSSYFLKLPSLSDDSTVFSSIPSGDYSCTYRLCDGLLRVSTSPAGEPLTVRILPDQPANLEIDLSRASRLNATLVDELDLEYRGPAVFRTRDANRRVYFVGFESAPYTLLGFTGGAVLLGVTRGGAAAPFGEEEFAADVEVGAGGTHELELKSRFREATGVK